MPQRWSRCGYLEGSFIGLSDHNCLEEFELGLHWGFCVTPIRADVECRWTSGWVCRGSVCPGMVLNQGFLLKICGSCLLGASMGPNQRFMSPVAFSHFPKDKGIFSPIILFRFLKQLTDLDKCCYAEQRLLIVNSPPSWNEKYVVTVSKMMCVQLLFIDFDNIWLPGKGFNSMRSCWVGFLVQSIKSLHDFFLKAK